MAGVPSLLSNGGAVSAKALVGCVCVGKGRRVPVLSIVKVQYRRDRGQAGVKITHQQGARKESKAARFRGESRPGSK